MNLYIFNETENAAVYGIGTYIRELTYALKDSGIKINVVNLRFIQSKFEIKTTDDVNYWYIPEIKYQNPDINSIQEIEDYYCNVTYLLQLYIKDTHKLIFHFNFNQSQVLAKKLKETFDCKVIATIHYLKWSLQFHGNIQKLHYIRNKEKQQKNKSEQLLSIVDKYEHTYFETVDQILVLSHYSSDILHKEYLIDLKKIYLIYNGINDQLTLHVSKNDLRKRWWLAKDEKLILFVGRLNEAKGLSYLIRAFNKLLKVILNCRLLIAGHGFYDLFLQECKEFAAKVTFTGLIPQEKLFELYQIADIGILPSFTEQCSYVAIEMMMSGLPMVTTAAPGLAEMTEDGISSLQVPIIEHPDRVEIDTDLLAEKMLYLLQNQEEAKRLGKNARKRYEERYSGEIFRNNMLDFYHSLYPSS